MSSILSTLFYSLFPKRNIEGKIIMLGLDAAGNFLKKDFTKD
jgi:hypothetical protein